jgi:hypothetical protein
MVQVAIVLGSEFAVDWIKHCFILKFNNMRADIYAKFSMILRSDILDARNEVTIAIYGHASCGTNAGSV